MNQEVKKEWVKALKSGKYKQGEGALRVNNKFCCLGVLCDIYARKTNDVKWEHSHQVGKEKVYKYIEERAQLPTVVKQWSNLTFDEENYFVILNDSEKLTFEEIAIYIENGL